MFRRLLTTVSLLALSAVLGCLTATVTCADGPSVAAPIDVRADGAFGFDQSRAIVLCDTPELRLSALSDGEHLLVQAVLWHDNDDALGHTDQGRAIGDTFALRLAVAETGEVTPDRDRNYYLDALPPYHGLLYTLQLDERATTTLREDPTARGAIRHVQSPQGRVRVDTILVSLREIRPLRNETVRLAYWGSSPKPSLIVNSIGSESDAPYWSSRLPRDRWHSLSLDAIEGVKIDPSLVPHDRRPRDPGHSAPRGGHGKYG